MYRVSRHLQSVNFSSGWTWYFYLFWAMPEIYNHAGTEKAAGTFEAFSGAVSRFADTVSGYA